MVERLATFAGRFMHIKEEKYLRTGKPDGYLQWDFPLRQIFETETDI